MEIKELFMLAFQRPKSQGDYLVNAKLKSICTGVNPKRAVKCGQE